MALDGKADPRAPLDVYPGEDGTYEITDGNATAQALMLGTPVPHLQAWASTVIVGLGAMLLASRLYRHHQADLMDNL